MMAVEDQLAEHLAAYAGSDPVKQAAARTVAAVAAAGLDLSRLVAAGARRGQQGAVVGSNLGGDQQKALDVESHEIVRAHARAAGVAVLGSEEADDAEVLDPAGLVALAVDPLDGSSNIETNVSVGTIFSVLPATPGADPFRQKGSAQLAGGYVIYGPHTDIVFTLGDGVLVFTLDREAGTWHRVGGALAIAEEANEFAVNASNYRHWADGTRAYVDDCLAGASGPREKDFNMRWVASMVAEASRILVRGGIFLYPGDDRRGYARGRLRLVYEANPIAFLIEQAGGRASDGRTRILDLEPTELHQRTPLIFGAAAEVRRYELYEASPPAAERSPLFGYRGLYRT